MKKARKWLCFLLAVILALQPVSYAQASGNADASKSQTETTDMYQLEDTLINPVYADSYSKADLQIAAKNRIATYAEPGDDYASDTSALAGQIRDYMINRSESFMVYYYYEGEYEQNDFKARVNEAFEKAFEETDDPHAGDYLKWNWGGHRWSASISISGDIVYGNITVTAAYHTTKDQEEEFDSLLSAAMNNTSIDSENDSAYQKITKVHNYICEQVTYDYGNLNDDTYKLKHTAYAALKNGTAVCQGYATLMYRMLREADIEVRVITGDATNSAGETGGHAWNAAKLGSKYYLLDSTWNDSLGGTQYFLKGTETFDADHFVDETECTFYKELNVSSTDYDENAAEEVPEEPEVETPEVETPEQTTYTYELATAYNDVTEADEYFIYEKDANGNIVKKYDRIEIINAEGAHFVTPNGENLEDAMLRFPDVAGAEDMLWYDSTEPIEFCIIQHEGYVMMFDSYTGNTGSISYEWDEESGVSWIPPGNGNIKMQLFTAPDDSGSSGDGEDDGETEVIYDGITIEGIRLSDNAKTLKAGDDFTLTLTLKNNKDSEITVYPYRFMLRWNTTLSDGTIKEYWEYPQGEEFTIPGNETRDYEISIETKEFTYAGERVLDAISYYSEDGYNVEIHYTNYKDENRLEGIDADYEYVHELEYQGEADWNVTTAENTDIQAPIVESISVVSENVKVPGNVRFKMLLSDEGPAKVDVISLTLYHEENEECYIYKYLNREDLISIDGGYEFEVELPLDLITGTYHFIDFAITDQAAESRYYTKDAFGEMVNEEGYSFANAEVEIIESEYADTDFENPEFYHMTFDSEITAGQDLEASLYISNEEELGEVILTFVKKDAGDYKVSDYIIVGSRSIKKEDDGSFTCVFPINAYVDAGEYIIKSVRVQDKSTRQNTSMYNYEPDNNRFYESSSDTYVDYKGSTDLTVASSSLIITNDNELSQAIEDAFDGSTIVVTNGVDDDYIREISAENLLAAKAKSLTLVLVHTSYNSEIIIDTKDISDDFTGVLYAGIARTDLLRKGLYIEGMEKPDLVYYPFDIVFSEEEIPFTIRINVNDDFEDQSIRISEYSSAREKRLVVDGLAYNNGIVEYRFHNGIGNEINLIEDGQYSFYYAYLSAGTEVDDNPDIPVDPDVPVDPDEPEVPDVPVDEENPVAVIMPEEITGLSDKAILFSGVNSTDNDAIASYEWDFGDGKTGTGATCNHAYSKQGDYIITLTVTDKSGNKATTSKSVKIYSITGEDAEYALVSVKVRNGYADGTPAIAGANVYIYGENNFETSTVTGEDGIAELVVPRNANVLSVVADGFTAASRALNIDADENGKYSCIVNMVSFGVSPVDGSLTTKELTPEEIEAAGIDTSNPDNQHVVEMKVTMEFKGGLDTAFEIDLSGLFNDKGELLDGEGFGWNFIELPDPFPDDDDDDDDDNIDDTPRPKPVLPDPIDPNPSRMKFGVYPISEKFFLVIYGEAHWLKEMYNVELVVLNNSYAEDITDCVAELELPQGLSLASLIDQAQSEIVEFGTIEKASGTTVNTVSNTWYVRGDAVGEYYLSANVNGNFTDESENKTPFELTFTTTDPVKVYAGEALKLTITAQDTAFQDEDYYVQFTLKNVSDKSLYNLAFALTDAEQYEVQIMTNKTEKSSVMTQEDFENNISCEISSFDPGETIDILFKTTTRFDDEKQEFVSGYIPATQIAYRMQDFVAVNLEGSTTEIPTEIQTVPVKKASFGEWLGDQAEDIVEGKVVELVDKYFFKGIPVSEYAVKVFEFVADKSNDHVANSSAVITVSEGAYLSATKNTITSETSKRSAQTEKGCVAVYTDGDYTLSEDGKSMTVNGDAKIYVLREGEGEAGVTVTTTYQQDGIDGWVIGDNNGTKTITYELIEDEEGSYTEELCTATDIMLEDTEVSEIYAPEDDPVKVEFPYMVKGEDGGFYTKAGNISWSVKASDGKVPEGISVENGIVTVNKTAESGTYQVIAAIEGTDKEVVKEITVIGHREGEAVKENFKAATLSAAGSYEMAVYCEECKAELSRTKTAIPKIASAKISSEKYTYNGNIRKPTVTVKDSKGKILKKGVDYTLSGSINGKSSVGRYSIKITFKGNYSGTKTLYYVIVPKAVTNFSVIRYQYGNKLLWNWTKPSGGASGYRIQYKKAGAASFTTKYITAKTYTLNGLTQNKNYTCKVTPYYKDGNGTKHYGAEKSVSIATASKGKLLSKVTKPTVAKNGSGKVKVTWKNVANESGYEISKSTSGTGTNIVATVAGSNTKTKVISATKNKKYYYKVRAYRTVNGKKIYGAWSVNRAFTLK